MKLNFKKLVIRIAGVLITCYTLICITLYVYQEKLIFHPEVLAKDYKYNFDQTNEEVFIKTNTGEKLNALLFRADSSKGVILYLHGNGGSLEGWGQNAEVYTKLHYDILMLDYRGYGKSEGQIKSEEQFYNDVQNVYDWLQSRYDENKIIVLGYSIGTASAAMLADHNHPKMLILQAPYYNLIDMMHHYYPFIPKFLLKYKFKTNDFLKRVKAPIVIFHGDNDEVIYYGSSLKLKELLKPHDTLIILHGQGHNRMSDNGDYLNSLEKLLR
jgi:pimeloyl-ACP methyl ester carboxylesterase